MDLVDVGGKGDHYFSLGLWDWGRVLYLPDHTTDSSLWSKCSCIFLWKVCLAECMDGFLYLSCVPNCPLLLVCFNAQHLLAFIYQINAELSSRHALFSTHRWVFINLDVGISVRSDQISSQVESAWTCYTVEREERGEILDRSSTICVKKGVQGLENRCVRRTALALLAFYV